MPGVFKSYLLLLLCFPVFTAMGQEIMTGRMALGQKIENLVFEGAGIRGIAYSGAIRELENAGMMADIKRVGGTSAGAITALMVALGYNSNEIYRLIDNTHFEEFNDGEMMFVGGFSRLKKKFGWYKGDAFMQWIETVIATKTEDADITFSQMREKGYNELFVTATCLNRQKLLVFSANTYPDMKVKDAVRISMSVPLYFEAVFIDRAGKTYAKPKKKKDLDVVVDGGILANFPIFIFDDVTVDDDGKAMRTPNYATLGIRIDSDEQIAQDKSNRELAPIEIENLSDYLTAFYILALENLNRNMLTDDDWNRTISVSSAGIGPKVKRLTDGQKKLLIESGETHTRGFLKTDTIQILNH